MRKRGNTVRVYSSASNTLRFTATVSGGSGYAGIRSDNQINCQLLRLGDAWTYEPYERFDVVMPDVTETSFGRIERSNCTWDEEFQVFTLTSDVEEYNTRSVDFTIVPWGLGRLFHSVLSGCGQPDLLGEPGGIPMETARDVYVVPWTGRYASLGMAAQAN